MTSLKVVLCVLCAIFALGSCQTSFYAATLDAANDDAISSGEGRPARNPEFLHARARANKCILMAWPIGALHCAPATSKLADDAH